MPRPPAQGTSRRTLTFDARSVMLFAALTMGGAAIQAQTSSAPSSTSAPSSSSAPLRLQAGTAGPGLRSSTRNDGGGAQASIDAAFDRADANGDGRLSAAEAASLPAIGNRFKELDKDRDGSLSREEFQAGATS